MSNKLSPPQAEILESGILFSGFNCVVQMPTGSGKTWLAEQAIHETLKNGSRAIYLTPLRALADELVQKWKNRFDVPVGVFTGDYGSDNQYPIPFRLARVMIMTPEKMDACTRHWQFHWNWIPEVDLIVADELHLLGESQRGARLEGALSRMMRLNPFLRILGLSATLGNRHEIADWLHGVEYASTWRPIPINWRIVKYRKADHKPELLLQEVKQNILNGGKTLVFVLSRRRAEYLSSFLKTNGIHARHHHAGLSQVERKETEKEFRNNQIDVLISTATLEMGLNLPVRQVILYDLQTFNGADFQPLSTNTVWQRIGRAGRPGFDPIGEAVLFSPSWESNEKEYIAGNFEPILSALANQKPLTEQIIVEISSGLARNRTQLKRVLSLSLAARQNKLPDVDNLIFDMKRAGMISDDLQDDGYGLKVTRIGRIAVRHFLSPETVILFKNILENFEKLSFFDLLLIASSTIDSEPILPVDFEEIEELEAKVQEEISYLLQKTSIELKKLFNLSGKRFLASLKMAIVLRAWTRGMDPEEISKNNNCYAFELQRLKENSERLLLAMNNILSHEDISPQEDVNENRASLREKIDALSKMIGQGLDEETVSLTIIKGVGAKTAKKLHRQGISDIEVLAASTPQELTSIQRLTIKRATKWIEEANQLLCSHSAYYFREEGPKIRTVSSDWPMEIDPYRLRRALDLKVKSMDVGIFLVSGGLEPHLVQTLNQNMICDCLDYQKGHLCKHIIALRLQRGDRQIKNLVKTFLKKKSSSELSLFDLWFSQP